MTAPAADPGDRPTEEGTAGAGPTVVVPRSRYRALVAVALLSSLALTAILARRAWKQRSNRRAQDPLRVEVAPPLAGAALLERLRAGGLVLFVRHFHKAMPEGSRDALRKRHEDLTPADLADCQQQHLLSDFGAARAREVGEAVRALGIPIGVVLSSPYCRCLDSARALAGREPDAVHMELGSRLPSSGTRGLEALLEKVPEGGRNTWIFGHGDATTWTSYLPEGGALVFEPVEGARPRWLGKLYPYDWLRAGDAPQAFGAEGAHDIRLGNDAYLRSMWR